MPFLRHGPTVALLAMVLLALAHVGLILARDYQHFLEVIQGEVRTPADRLAAVTNEYFTRYGTVLEALSEAPCVRERYDCGDMFPALTRRFAGAVNFAALDQNGDFFESGLRFPEGRPPNVAKVDWFRDLRDQGKSLHVMDPHVGPISAEKVTGLILATRKPDGAFAGAVGVSLRFSELDGMWRAVRPLGGVSVLITDSAGAVIFAAPGSGGPAAMPPLEALGMASRGGFGEVVADGRRWYSYHSLLPLHGWTIHALHPSALGVREYLEHSFLPASLLPPTLVLAVLGLILTWRNWRHVSQLERRVRQRTAELTASNVELAAGNVRLREANQELETFVWVASHDLREPLRAIATHVTLLERRHAAVLDDTGRDFIATARDAATRLDRLVLDLLEYASVGRVDAPLRAVDTGVTVRQVCRGMEDRLAKLGARIDIASDLPVVAARPGDIARLFDGVIRNALDHRHPERPPLIAVRAEPDGNDWRITVEDNAQGIEPAYFDKIFGLFQRLRPGDNPGATGAGLTICRKIVRHYGGEMWVESEPGKGSRFCFTLPGAVEMALHI